MVPPPPPPPPPGNARPQSGTAHDHADAQQPPIPRSPLAQRILAALPSTLVRPLATFLHDLLLTNSYVPLFAVLFLSCEAGLLHLIIRHVAFTEIDYATYLQQAALFVDGEVTDYTLITGDSGPCVYPAGHLYIYGWFWKQVQWYRHHGAGAGAGGRLAGLLLPLVASDASEKGLQTAELQARRFAQYVFAAVYLATFAIVIDIYRMASQPAVGVSARRARSPSTSCSSLAQRILSLFTSARSRSAAFPPVLHLLTFLLSKRLHSLYVLRLFNDPLAMLLFYAAAWLLCRRAAASACLVYSLALAVKMNLLLFLPAWAAVLFRMMGFYALLPASLIPLLQVSRSCLADHSMNVTDSLRRLLTFPSLSIPCFHGPPASPFLAPSHASPDPAKPTNRPTDRPTATADPRVPLPLDAPARLPFARLRLLARLPVRVDGELAPPPGARLPLARLRARAPAPPRRRRAALPARALVRLGARRARPLAQGGREGGEGAGLGQL